MSAREELMADGNRFLIELMKEKVKKYLKENWSRKNTKNTT